MVMPKKAKPIQAVTYMDENDTDPNEIELWVEEGLTNRNWLFPEEEALNQILADDWTPHRMTDDEEEDADYLTAQRMTDDEEEEPVQPPASPGFLQRADMELRRLIDWLFN